MTRAGFAAIIGAPNAGKSTLTNRLVGAKVSIVTQKVQTTRFPVRGVAMAGDAQIVLVDTPGIFQPRRRLDRAMIRAAWGGAQDADRTLLLFVLGYAWRHDPTFADAGKGPWPDADSGTLDDPRQLGLLWGRFFASGAFAPVQRIASALRMHDALGALNRLKAATPQASAPTPEVMKELVLKSAQWSLGRNAHAHPLVRRYCAWILAQKDPDAEFNSLLSVTIPDDSLPADRPSVVFPRIP